MKKIKLYKVCGVISFILVMVFVIKVIIDYITYKSTLNSAPFYLWIIVDAIYFLLPASGLAIVGWILQKKNK